MCSQPIHETTIEQLRVSVYPSNQATGQAAAEEATNTLRQTIREKGFANIIVATGNSQLTFLAALRRMPDIDWSSLPGQDQALAGYVTWEDNAAVLELRLPVGPLISMSQAFQEAAAPGLGGMPPTPVAPAPVP